MSKFLDDLDQLMMPYRCDFDKALKPDEWREIYNWLDSTCGKNKWYSGKNEFCFAREQHLIMFKLRWL